MLGCEICFHKICRVSTNLGRFWLDIVKESAYPGDIVDLISPEIIDFAMIEKLEKMNFLRSTETHFKDRVHLRLIHIHGYACNNPNHEELDTCTSGEMDFLIQD
ncbi:MAG TPA: hypothetical protein VNW29_04305 [Candidatus Sulfotelmatobacter sp.]|jgi:hypothetical protein|nr:hypothetical protein [Candidatus Sulfotelmatobacter sp.]